ncbi:aromatic compound dioxygenase [Trichodelitschia bisporula]|uniref:Aromatic compound dioxygenase n=1 Tax=Trichodelitschia bisporula TaxID=703511 RepID=A0A6G1I4A0_9PEZI|nr:aromatic compound dioxygenase [Trichodelitschia bisporula]
MVLLNLLVLGAGLAAAHPGHDGTAEMRERAAYMATLEKSDLVHCASKLASRGEMQRTVERRREMLRHLRQKRGLDPDAPHLRPRQVTAGPLAKTHKSDLKIPGLGLSSGFDVDWALLGQNKTTILSPEVTEGPYYIAGEFIRRDIREKEPGVALHLDVQIIDMKSCTPVPGIAVDLWHANSSGVYSGIGGFGNGNAADTSNLQNKALRGIQVSDKQGAVVFQTVMPGHYMGRTNHVHVMTQLNVTINPNNTISGGRVAHVGQLYFDQALLDAVSAIPPYSTNKNQRMLNAQDFLVQQGSAGGSDPVVEYVLLGNTLADGIFAWSNFGIDASANRRVMAAATCGADGCKAAPNPFGALGDALGALFGGFFGKGGPPKGPKGQGGPKGMNPQGMAPPAPPAL